MSRNFKYKSFSGIAGRRALAASTRNKARLAQVMRLRTAVTGRYPVGLPAFRGFRPVGLRRVGEKKVVDIGASTYQVNLGGSFTLLNGTQLGSDYTNRIGRKIYMKSLYIRGFVAPELAINIPTGVISLGQQARMIIFIDNQPNGATPAVTDLLVSASPASQLNLNNRDRFAVLRDETFEFSPMTTTNTPAFTAVSGELVKSVNKYLKINKETIYNAGNAGAIGDINSGALYMFWIGSFAGPGSDINAVVSTRLRFVDP